MLKKRSRKISDKHRSRKSSYQGRMMYKFNKSNPRADTLLKKTQYVDFQLVQTWPVGRVTAENYPFVLAFSRYDYGGIIASVNGFNNTPLWPRVKPLFEEYAITGFRFEYIPSNGRGMVFNSSATAISSGQLISECQIWEDINTYNIASYTPDQKKMCNGYQFFDPSKPMTVIRDNKPLARS